MPKLQANNFAMNYDEQGSGDALILIPYLTADHACYAFQVSEYAKHFRCISLDLRGTGESGSPEGSYSTETLADDVAAFMQAAGIARAHISGLSLGAAVGMWLAAKHPERVRSLSLHSAWPKTDAYAKIVIDGWQLLAKALGSVPRTTIRAIFPWCLTPELYDTRPEYIHSLAHFVLSRPVQSIDSFLRQSDAVLAHDATAQLSKITAPTLITFGTRDQITSTRFAEPLQSGIRNSELVVFENCAHAPIYERVEEFNQKTLHFLKGRAAAA
jgi:pimeloyl-ACP methyl ester carboxylesterase